ncbi:MAG: hypothetical protein JRN56_05305 [Nitrososphaerota archaeon]|jgi:hypothetical protein|nr:hypothetical protein [Nitrososphaerota archaeon]MDG6912734.1 hypothetical protein [Nitrososphaerota archaeon]MDG6952515.1 hypothetical protein [Nitrososphaerota archaeon]MDG6955616.1 hypothetical protein [Nitrososphaerota archaeon]MDG6973177.1 hypothetical protein [Nitrososphaerota archaeon]
MPKWTKDAKEFTVVVSYDGRRGAQAYIPKPVAMHLENPEAITYSIKGKRVEVSPASS